jgi:chloramphenicol-sensitive protein RarD
MTPRSQAEGPASTGLLAAMAAFVAWGLLPIYWKTLEHVPAFEVLCHRIVWSLFFSGMIIGIQGRWQEVWAVFSSLKAIWFLFFSSLLIATNWFVYIWAVNSGHVLETSLGYFINPLVNVLLAFVIFRDRLRPLQTLAVGFAIAGVANRIWHFGQFPVIALTLAVSFALYGLLRKLVKAESLPGLFCETAVLSLFAGGYLIFLAVTGNGAFGRMNMQTNCLLMGAGVVTSLPLLGFAFGARRLSLIQIGMLQYISPSLAFMLGAFVYHEPFSLNYLITFILIWTAVGIYSAEGIVRFKKGTH